MDEPYKILWRYFIVNYTILIILDELEHKKHNRYEVFNAAYGCMRRAFERERPHRYVIGCDGKSCWHDEMKTRAQVMDELQEAVGILRNAHEKLSRYRQLASLKKKPHTPLVERQIKLLELLQ